MKLGSKVSLYALGLLVAPLVLSAPAAATAPGLPVTPATPEPATAVDEPAPCINYPGNIRCNLSTFSAELGIGG